MKIIIHRGKHSNNLFVDSDDGWMNLFKYLKDCEGFYQSIKSGEDIKEAKRELADLDALKKSTSKLKYSAREHVEGSLQNIPRYEQELKDALRQKELYLKAVKGDAKSARDLIYMRHDYEYEDFSIGEVRG